MTAGRRPAPRQALARLAAPRPPIPPGGVGEGCLWSPGQSNQPKADGCDKLWLKGWCGPPRGATLGADDSVGRPRPAARSCSWREDRREPFEPPSDFLRPSRGSASSHAALSGARLPPTRPGRTGRKPHAGDAVSQGADAPHRLRQADAGPDHGQAEARHRRRANLCFAAVRRPGRQDAQGRHRQGADPGLQVHGNEPALGLRERRCGGQRRLWRAGDGRRRPLRPPDPRDPARLCGGDRPGDQSRNCLRALVQRLQGQPRGPARHPLRLRRAGRPGRARRPARHHRPDGGARLLVEAGQRDRDPRVLSLRRLLQLRRADPARRRAQLLRPLRLHQARRRALRLHAHRVRILRDLHPLCARPEPAAADRPAPGLQRRRRARVLPLQGPWAVARPDRPFREVRRPARRAGASARERRQGRKARLPAAARPCPR